jgi:hypothetical protein
MQLIISSMPVANTTDPRKQPVRQVQNPLRIVKWTAARMGNVANRGITGRTVARNPDFKR